MYAKLTEAFEAEHNENISKVLSIAAQIVAGINYKIDFETPSTIYEGVVFFQPWTNTIEVLSIQRKIQN